MTECEQMYRFIDKSGHCFSDFQSGLKTPPKDDVDKIIDKEFGNDDEEQLYRDRVGAMLRASNDGEHNFSVGDMLCFRDELQEVGFEWGKDFYVSKV